ncbi:hypothetical protein SADUNF_Sadunf16G0174900 [Salix dunnii]|uniref:Uncharacterized protein n=1 Tax=Salix dunnii TaxID=1413687 RepID=A0A835JEV1_9ROSI|nr:hypothetical protein SADUNF_Sadunf16G0174900 [Salix dunnii]
MTQPTPYTLITSLNVPFPSSRKRGTGIRHKNKSRAFLKYALLDPEYELPVQVCNTTLTTNSCDSTPKRDLKSECFVMRHECRTSIES